MVLLRTRNARALSRLWPLGLALALLSCAKRTQPSTEEPPVEAAKPPSVAVEVPPEDAPSAKPIDDGRPLGPPSEEVLAYIASCDHRFEVEGDPELLGDDQMVHECLYEEFDQNCAPDIAGCWESGQSCDDGCRTTCDECQNSCAAICGSCKQECADGDERCVRLCAERRAECRTGCMDVWDRCLTSDCRNQETTCYDDHEEEKAERCPNCEEIGECLMRDRDSYEEDPRDLCAKEFPKADEVCLEWCYDFF